VVQSELLPKILVQETPLLEIFQNLIANAVKYRREGTTPRIRVSARPDDGQWEFSVADNGKGVPEKHRETIFLPFKRLHGGEIPGTGMGLAICNRIVKHLGGRIWVESNGSGATFRFTLPAGEPS
jgi:signal transduction histidine kinase